MKEIKKVIKPMNISEKLNLYLRLWRKRQQAFCQKDYAKRKDNLRNHIKKDLISENLYILICTMLYALIVLGFCIIMFIWGMELITKLLIK